MGLTKKRCYDRYTLKFKEQAVRLADHPKVRATEIADILDIHVVMLYRWRMEIKNGTLVENKHMKKKKAPPKRKKEPDLLKVTEDELKLAQSRIKQLEKNLAAKEEEIDILKKAQRFFAKRNK